MSIRYYGRIPRCDYDNPHSAVSSFPKGRRYDLKHAAGKYWIQDHLSGVEFDRLHYATFARQGVERPSGMQNRVISIVEQAQQLGLGHVVAAFRGSKSVAVAHFLLLGTSGYYILGATDQAERCGGAGTLVVFEGLLESARRGLSDVDVVGMNSPQRSRFKRSMGAQVFPFYQVAFRR